MAPKPFDQFVSFIYCDDLDAVSDFYGRILGLPMVLDQGPCRIFRVAGDGFLGVCTRMDRPTERNGIILTLVSDDVDGWYRHLKDCGLAIEKTPQLYEKFNIYHLFVRDPAGYLVEIQEFKDPAWPVPISRPSGSGAP